MSRRHNALISDGNSSTTPLIASGAEIITFRAASGAGAGAATSLVITKPAGVVLDDVMVAQVAQGADAAPTFVAASSNNAGGGGSITVNKPAGTAQDDVMIAKISISNNVDSNPPAGWTLIRDDGTGPRQKLFWKRAGASEPASYAFTTAGTSTRTITIVAYRGVVLTGDPIDAHGGQLGTTAATAPSITTTGFHRMLVACFSSDQPQATSSWTPPDGMTERSDEAIFINLEVISAETADQVVQQGATGTRTATQNGVSTETIGALVALKPKAQTLQTITSPAGWTTIRTDDSDYRSSLYWLRAGAAEPADYTWTFGGTVDAAGTISAYDGVLLIGDPIDVNSGAVITNSVHTAVVAPSVTTTAANTMLLG